MTHYLGVHGLIISSLFVFLTCGCSGQPTASPDGTGGGEGVPEVSTEENLTAEQRTAKQIEWKLKAVVLLNRVTDERSAQQLAGELKLLVQEYERSNKAAANLPPLSAEEKAAIQAKYGAELEAATLKYIEAAGRIESGEMKPVVDYLKQNQGIDLVRMRTVE